MRPGTPGFVGARLRQAREARGMTASNLADAILKSRAAVCQYETDTSPSPEVFNKICEVLNLDRQWFLRPMTAERGSGTIFFRCMSSATKGARLRAERRYDWLREITATLREKLVFPNPNFPELDFGSDPSQISDRDVDAAATVARRFWGMNDGPISNMAWLLENNGAVVSRFDLHAATLDAYSEWEKLENRPYVILGADKGSACRSRFDAAHELAHLILHRHVPKATYTPNVAFRLMEDQANRFASAFLLPDETFLNEFNDISLDGFLAKKTRWRVSVALMIMKASHLGIVRGDQERKLWINYTRRKWRGSEPLDDTLEVEQPNFLRRCFEVLISKGFISPDAVRIQLGISETDIEELVVLPRGFLGRSDPEVQIRDDAEPRIIRFPKVS